MPRLADELVSALKFDQNGLIPAIAQQWDSCEVLMMAWMSEDSLAETLASGRVCYWSRSRRALWRKGETSGHIQTLRAIRADCDGDTLLLLVDQTGAACHNGTRSCFMTELTADTARPAAALAQPAAVMATPHTDEA